MTDRSPLPLPPQAMPLTRGALVRLDAESSTRIQQTLVFQYSPSQLVRNLSPSAYSSDTERLTDLPTQSIQLSLQLESTFTDFRGTPFGTAQAPPREEGLLPQIDALELMMAPRSDALRRYRKDLQSGKMAAIPPSTGRTLFIWGPRRILPVVVVSIGVTEQVFNHELVPVRATVAVRLKVLSLTSARPKEEDYLFAYLGIQEKRARSALLPGKHGARKAIRVGVD